MQEVLDDVGLVLVDGLAVAGADGAEQLDEPPLALLGDAELDESGHVNIIGMLKT